MRPYLLTGSRNAIGWRGMSARCCLVLAGSLAGCSTMTSDRDPAAMAVGQVREGRKAAVPPATEEASEIRQASFQPAAEEPAPAPKPDVPRELPAESRKHAELLPAPHAKQAAGLTLDQAINATLLADPKLRAGFEAINLAHADALTASLVPNPTLFTDIQLLPLTRPFTVTEQGGPPQQDVFVGMPIDWCLFGKRAAAMAAACLGVRVSEADYADLVRLRVLETALAYYDVLEAKALLELAGQDVVNLERVEEVTRKAVENGGRPRVELNRVRLNLLTAQRTQRDAEAALVIAKARLRALMGRSDADPDFEVAGRLDVPLGGELLSPEAAYGLALDNRPDLQSLRWKNAQATASVEREDRAAWPQVTPQLGYTRQYQRKAIGFPDANSWDASLTMTVPLFDRNQGNRAKARATTAQSAFELQAAEVRLRAEVEQAVQELRTARLNAQAVAQEQLDLAAQVRDSINQAYGVGGRPLLDVLDAQRNYRDTYRIYIGSHASYWRARHKLNATLGRQVSHDEPAPSAAPRR